MKPNWNDKNSLLYKMQLHSLDPPQSMQRYTELILVPVYSLESKQSEGQLSGLRWCFPLGNKVTKG